MNKQVNAFLILLFLFTYQPFSFCQLVINEVYADVAVSIIGDANGDGVRSAREDEFIELFNNSETTVDLSNFVLEIGGLKKHEFEQGIILPAKSFLVVFGGGKPNGLFGNSSIFLASSGNLSLSNAGTTVALKDSSNSIIDTMAYEANNIDASLVRTPSFLGEFKPHTERPDAFEKAFSPGTLANSFPYNDGTTTLIQFNATRGVAIEQDDSINLFLNLVNPKPNSVVATIELTGGSGSADDLANFTPFKVNFPVNAISQRMVTIPISNDELIEGKETFIFTITAVTDPDSNQISINQSFELTLFDDDTNFGLVLTEFLADPPNDPTGDANKDGERSSTQDEFIEFLNITDSPIDLSGMVIQDAKATRHTIPDSTIILPNQLFLIFGGGDIFSNFGEAIVQKANTGRLSLDNSGDRIIIRDSLNDIIFFHEFGEEASVDQSIVLCPIDLDGSYTKHTSVSADIIFSPGILHECTTITSVQAQYDAFIQLFPNPATNQLTVDLSRELMLKKGLELVNMQGQKIATTSTNSLALHGIPKGLYLLKVGTNKGIFVKKVIIQ